VKWVSTSGEFAFLSFGGTAKGIIAVGGTAHGIVAVGGFLSIGVISIGMNAVGSVAAFGLNAAAPISLSLINSIGVYTLAGVNGWGAWSKASTSSTGISSHGGVNSDYSVLPAVFIVIALIIGSSVARGARDPRAHGDAQRLRKFARSKDLAAAKVSARLVAVLDNSIALEDHPERLVAEVDDTVRRSADAIADAASTDSPRVIAHLERTSEFVPVSGEASYRARPAEAVRVFLRCVDIERDPAESSWLPKDANEVQWVIAWTARISVVATILMVAWWTLH
jgi:hypothetical protein